jgi:Putative F0F1-ATPase subunit Ca2+/Mg2+ transporter
MESPEPSRNKRSSQYNPYLKYSGLAIQLLAAIGFFGWLGYRLDAWLEIKFPAFLLLFGFLAFAGMMLQIYRSINQDNN